MPIVRPGNQLVTLILQMTGAGAGHIPSPFHSAVAYTACQVDPSDRQTDCEDAHQSERNEAG